MGDDVPIGLMVAALCVLLVLSGFFSGSETALMSLNRYRLRHRARSGHRPSRIAEKLLERPDRLIGLILLGNNAVNILAASLTTVISLRLGGQAALAIGAGILTLVLLIFAEVAPKTLAALHPERVALPAAYVYYPLLKILYPVVWFVNLVANGVLWLLGVRDSQYSGHGLSHEELRTVVGEASSLISRKYRRMLISILDLEKVTVDDVMVSRSAIVAIDLEDDIDEIVKALQHSEHTRLPVYRDSIDNIVGMLHLKRVVRSFEQRSLTKDALLSLLAEPYFVPEGTPLSTQLVQFQKRKRRVAMVVDEYGDLQGMVTLEDILEEIVGEFTTDPAADDAELTKIGSDVYIVNGTINIRELNRLVNWDLPTDGPKTLNGLILEHLEAIPDAGTEFQLGSYNIKIIKTAENMVQSARLKFAPDTALAAASGE